MKKATILFLIIMICNYVFSQNKKNEPKVLKLSWDNDLLNSRLEETDRGYTNGIEIQVYYTKKVKPKFPSNLFLKFADSTNSVENIYSWGIIQQIFTPEDILQKDIIYGDRPYAGILYASHSLASSDPIKKQKLTTSINFGTIGKYSFAKELQTEGHKLINEKNSQGWDNQIKSDIIINYGINYERLLLQPFPYIQILGSIQANAGTLFNNLGFGVQFRGGLFNNYFSNDELPTFKNKTITSPSVKKSQFYFYMKTNRISVISDATLNWIGTTMPEGGADGATKKDWKYRACSHLSAAKRDGYVDKMNTHDNFCEKQ